MDDTTRKKLMDAGASAVEFNSPMGDARAREIGLFVAAQGTSLLDLGCGRGALCLRTAEQNPQFKVHGVDSDTRVIEYAQKRALDAGLSDRVRFEAGEAETCRKLADVSACIGASHALGGTEQMFELLRAFGQTAAVVGDMFWSKPPSPALLGDFGELPAGESSLAAMAASAGWSVIHSSRSTLEEWDEFEGSWIDGVREVGTVEALTFAQER